MPIGVPEHADHAFRDDPDQLIMIVGTAIAIPGIVVAMPPKHLLRHVFHFFP